MAEVRPDSAWVPRCACHCWPFSPVKFSKAGSSVSASAERQSSATPAIPSALLLTAGCLLPDVCKRYTRAGVRLNARVVGLRHVSGCGRPRTTGVRHRNRRRSPQAERTGGTSRIARRRSRSNWKYHRDALRDLVHHRAQARRKLRRIKLKGIRPRAVGMQMSPTPFTLSTLSGRGYTPQSSINNTGSVHQERRQSERAHRAHWRIPSDVATRKCSAAGSTGSPISGLRWLNRKPGSDVVSPQQVARCKSYPHRRKAQIGTGAGCRCRRHDFEDDPTWQRAPSYRRNGNGEANPFSRMDRHQNQIGVLRRWRHDGLHARRGRTRREAC